MLRKMMIVLIAMTAMGAVAIPTDVSARSGHGGWRGGGHFGGFRGGGFGFRSYGYPYYAGVYGSSCWRVQATPYGLRRVWVCGGYGYPYY
jgi:hypothetical protein